MEKSLAELVDNTAFDARTNNTSKDDLNSGNTLTKILPDTAGRYEVFPINDIQESFLTGRKLRFGGDWTGCHIYFEIERDNLDIYRLNKAWERLMERHDMLRAVILPNGNQKVLEKTPVYRFKTADLRWKNQIEIKEYIQKVREKMSHKVYESDKWPLYEIRISLCPENKYIIHFSIDELIIDASGIYLLLKEWQMLYENPSLELPSLEISFRDYIIATRKFEKSERYSRDLEYWMKRLENIPDGPKFITGPNKDREFSNNDYYRIRLNGILEKERWSHLKMRAEELKVSPTAVLLSIFSEFIRIWSGQEEFSLVLTLFNRLPLHPQIDQIIGHLFQQTFLLLKKEGNEALKKSFHIIRSFCGMTWITAVSVESAF
nr:condensation domain-containing protein [Ruminiclostridium josui]